MPTDSTYQNIDSTALESVAIDTTAIDSAAVDSAVVHDEIVLPTFDDCSYFSGDTLLHNEAHTLLPGFESEAIPPRYQNNDWGILLLLFCVLLSASLLTRFRGKMRQEMHDFFFPPSVATPDHPAENRLGPATRLTSCILLSLCLAVVTFILTQQERTYYPFAETPYLIFAAFTALWLIYFILKRLMGAFVNWVFFEKKKIFTWNRSVTFVYAGESLLFLPLTIGALYLPMPYQMSLIPIAAVILLAKILLLYKTYRIFFPKFYGFFHLLLYLCSLEMMPLLLVIKVLAYIDCLNGVKI